MSENKTYCYSYFFIESNGMIEDTVGFTANPNSDFEPDYITKKLNIEPFETRKMNTPRKNGNGVFPFSSWCACEQTEPALDAYEQVLKIIEILKPKISALNEIKKEYDVCFGINIVPYIYNEESPAIYFEKEIIEFCYLTGTDIGIDLYIFDKD